MSNRSFEECPCLCHRWSNVKHCVACCDVCPVCGKNISFHYLEAHLKHHQQNLEQLILEKIKPRIRSAWSQDTTSPSCQKIWSRENPAQGQCAVTALLIQDLLGGELLRTKVPGHGSHYYNRLPSGDTTDLTAEQFPPETDIPQGEPRDREYVLNSPGAVVARTNERYELLKNRYTSVRPGR